MGDRSGGGVSPYPLLLDDADVSSSLMANHHSLPDLLDGQNRPLSPQQHPINTMGMDQQHQEDVDHNQDGNTHTDADSRKEAEAEAVFTGALETNVTVGLGQTAFLRCRLKSTQHQVSLFVCLFFKCKLNFKFIAIGSDC